ncbi:MAG TPA: hypothetical protein VFX59_00335 [Polyangiales bacterium]|nr:hypothetical protein [Polyangiales bacterium]
MRYVLALAILTGCIKVPEIVMVDRATALEQQASGSFEGLERDLTVGAVGARPLPLTPDQLEALGIMPAPIIDQTEQTEPDRLDALLRQRCVGEGNDGLLVDTHDDCIGAADRNQALTLIDRTNRARVQLWQWMQKERPEQSVDTLRTRWFEEHARNAVCRAWMQRPDGSWGPKAC